MAKRTQRTQRTERTERKAEPQKCRVCGCTDDDCSGCIERTGQPCHWVAPDLCSACEAVTAMANTPSVTAAGPARRRRTPDGKERDAMDKCYICGAPTPNFPPVHPGSCHTVWSICCTSAADGAARIRTECDSSRLYLARAYEGRHQNRATIIRAIDARLRKLETKQNKGA